MLLALHSYAETEDGSRMGISSNNRFIRQHYPFRGNYQQQPEIRLEDLLSLYPHSAKCVYQEQLLCTLLSLLFGFGV